MELMVAARLIDAVNTSAMRSIFQPFFYLSDYNTHPASLQTLLKKKKPSKKGLFQFFFYRL